jgi:four helix bundle protein
VNSEELKDRTKRFAINIIKFAQTLPKTDECRIIEKQLIKSSTSVAANYRAACRARSKNEFYSKICIVLEECDESLFWLEVIIEAELSTAEILHLLKKEALELTQIFSSSRKTIKLND